MSRVAAAVIWYNPKPEVIDNILTYINQVDRLFIADNSEVKIDVSLMEFIKNNTKVVYINNHSNMGIAAALNISAEKAIQEGYDYLLTMDSDSKAAQNMVSELMKIYYYYDNVGLITGEHINLSFQEIPNPGKTEEILFTMTNGNLINLSAYKEVGGFWEELFIDHVDHEYCLRLKSYGYKIIKTSNTYVFHQLGNILRKNFFGFHLYPTNHSAVRLYYRTRNRLFVDNIYKKKFPEYIKEDRRNMIRELIEIILYDDHLLKKLKMMYLAFKDYKRNNLGKFLV